jgi:hypothetical protein
MPPLSRFKNFQVWYCTSVLFWLNFSFLSYPELNQHGILLFRTSCVGNTAAPLPVLFLLLFESHGKFLEVGPAMRREI